MRYIPVIPVDCCPPVTGAGVVAEVAVLDGTCDDDPGPFDIPVNNQFPKGSKQTYLKQQNRLMEI